MSKLKPCPFCGGEAEVYGKSAAFVGCNNCGARGQGCDSTHDLPTECCWNPKLAIAAWNRRASDWQEITETNLPDRIGDYLCLMRYVPGGFGYSVCTYLGDDGIDGVYGFSVSELDRRNGGTIAHWMPLPDPPAPTPEKETNK